MDTPSFALPMEETEEPPQLLTHLEPDLLRGVSLPECLSGFGKHWRTPGAGMSKVSYSDYNLSRPMEYFDDFLSHDWGTSRWLKVASMLIIYNSRAALVAMLLTAIVLVPTWWSHVPGCKSDYLVLHQRFLVVGICHGVHLLFLCFWQRFRSLLFTPPSVFLDKLCIAQSPELADVKAKGILGLAAFMKHSKRLVVLWSPRYFQRLWCSYEIATFLADRRPKPVVVMPAHSGLLLLLEYIGFSGAVNTMWYICYLFNADQWSQSNDHMQVLILALLGCLFTASFSLPLLSLSIGLAESVQQAAGQLRGFRMQDTLCFCCSNQHRHPVTGERTPCDRQLVYLKLKEWYGNHADKEEEYFSRFNLKVQTDLASLILDRMSYNAPRRYKFYMLTAASIPHLSEALARILHRTMNDCIHVENDVLDIVRWVLEWMTVSMSLFLGAWWTSLITARIGVHLSQYMPRPCVAIVLYPVCACPMLIFLGGFYYLILVDRGLWCGMPCGMMLLWALCYACRSMMQRSKSPVKAENPGSPTVEIQTETASWSSDIPLDIPSPASPAASTTRWSV